jgi:hypothetical protein
LPAPPAPFLHADPIQKFPKWGSQGTTLTSIALFFLSLDVLKPPAPLGHKLSLFSRPIMICSFNVDVCQCPEP